jgi:hypothetical protein
LSSLWEGSAQLLKGGEVLTGWGQAPYVSEFNARGRIDFDIRFNTGIDSYRAYRFPWSGQPDTPPAVAVRRARGGGTTVYASWNGATAVRGWRVLAGPNATRLSGAGTFAKRGFETAMAISGAQRFYAVAALDSAGHVLARSRAVGR